MARAKGRRRWTIRLVVLGALVWLLGWQGLGWLSGPGSGDTGENGGGDPSRESARDTGQTAPSSERDAVGDPPAERQSGGERRPEIEPPEVAGGEDHVRALFRLTERAVDTGMLGGGFQALDELDALPIAAARREDSRTARAALEEHLDEGIATLRQEILEGRLLAARRRLGDLLRIPHSEVARALDELSASQRWPALRGDETPPGYVPEPRPLPADRVVRFYRNGIRVRARTVDATAEEVTVRLRDERGVTYPSLPLTRIELPEATAAEAADMGLAALRAGDALLARLWLCHGISRGGGPQCRELAGLLA